ncbi:MAG: glycosyltransferase family 4 protein, partial [bacterium]
ISFKNSAKMIAEYQNADYIMTLSEFSRQSFLRQGIDEKKLLKVPCGIDTYYFSLPHRRDDGTKKFRVIFVGLVNLRKGVQYLLQAWNDLRLPQQDAELILVGALHKDMKQFLKTTPIQNNVVFYGSTTQADVRRLYRTASVFVLPSVEDGFGMVAGEAMASGLPVVCSDHTGAAEMISDGKEGFVIPACNADALAEKILWCYKNRDQAVEMGKLGQKTVENFSWDRYGDRVYEAYGKIVNEKNSLGE